MRVGYFLLLAILIIWPVAGMGQTDAQSLQSLLAQAQQAQAKSDYSAAADAYKLALKLDPQIAELWANLGVMQHESKDYSGAIVSFQRANALKPNLFVPNLFLGIDEVRADHAEQALSHLLRAEKLKPSDPQVPLAMGRAYLAVHSPSAAAQAYSRALELDPGNKAGWFGRGISYLEWVESDSAKLAKLDGKGYAQALFAESLAEQRRDRQAAALYKTILATPSRPVCAHAAFGFVLLQGGDAAAARLQFDAERKEKPACALAELGMAALSLNDGSTAEALAALQQMWELDRGFVRANLNTLVRAVPQARMEDLSTTSQAGDPGKYSRLSELLANPAQGAGPTTADHATSAAASPRTSQTVGSAAAAALLYREMRYSACADRLVPGMETVSEGALKLLASCAFLSGNYEVASQAGRVLEARNANDPETLYWSIKANEKLAFRTLARFEQLNPSSPQTHILLGDVYRQSDRDQAAEEEYQAALNLSKDDPGALAGLASAYLQDSKGEQAVVTCRQALAVLPDDPEVNLLMGEALISLHKIGEAEPFLSKALLSKPQMRPHVHALLGKVYAEENRPQDAVAELKLGLESDEDGSIHYQLGRQYLKLGDTESASAAMKESDRLRQMRSERATIAVQESSALDQ